MSRPAALAAVPWTFPLRLASKARWPTNRLATRARGGARPCRSRGAVRRPRLDTRRVRRRRPVRHPSTPSSLRSTSPSTWQGIARRACYAPAQRGRDRYLGLGRGPFAREIDRRPGLARRRGRRELAERWTRDGCWPEVRWLERMFGSPAQVYAEAGFDATFRLPRRDTVIARP